MFGKALRRTLLSIPLILSLLLWLGGQAVSLQQTASVEVIEETCDRKVPGTRRGLLIEAARQEQNAFDNAGFTEPSVSIDLVRRIAKYWGGVPRYDADARSAMKEILQFWKTSIDRALNVHWSAAFTSWLMCRAGFSMAEFKRGVGHRFYIDHALTAATAAHRVLDAARTIPQPGDLACADTSPRPRVRSVAHYQKRRPSFVHCHLVVLSNDSGVSVVGGNVEGRVRTTQIKPVMTERGTGLPWSSNRQDGWAWFAVLRLQPGRD